MAQPPRKDRLTPALMAVTIVFAIGYWGVYPSWAPQNAENSSEMAFKIERPDLGPRVEKATLNDIKSTPLLYDFARTKGEEAYGNNCAFCHGASTTGKPGIPNLNDKDWLHGGTLDQIYTTIRYGIRSGHPKAKGTALMPAFGRDGLLKPGEIEQVADFVIGLHEGERGDKTEAVAKGAVIYAASCSMCHGEKGDGNEDMGAPRLNDNVWLYGGGDRASVIASIVNARAGAMPAWEGRLDDRTMKEMAVYVHGLGGGK